jgi:hypothetical protein
MSETIAALMGRILSPRNVSLFCRHNRFVSDCPICSKGTVLDSQRRPERRPRPAPGGGRRRGSAAQPTSYKGPFATAGPYQDEESHYEVRLERVPGGLRLAGWTAGSIRRRAPVLAVADLEGLVRAAAEHEVLGSEQVEEALSAPGGAEGEAGRSPGRAGELRDELRVERLDGDRVRIARWVNRPGSGWELQEAPVMLPPGRYVEALADAGRRGVLSPS